MVKVGDKIRATRRFTDITIGNVYEVTEVDGNAICITDDAGEGNWQLWEDYYEVIPPVSDVSTSNPGLHSLYVENALRVLGVVETAIHELDEHSLVDSTLMAATLRRERAKLVAGNTAYQEAAFILYVGQDWLDEARKES